MLTFGFDRIILLIFLQITVLPQRISGKNELAYLAKNKDENGSKFWLLQESDEYLSFSWITFSPSVINATQFYLNINFQRQIDQSVYVDGTSGKFGINSGPCKESEYNIMGKRAEDVHPITVTHSLYYKRVPRIHFVQLPSRNLQNVTWEQESAFCSADDVTVIFSGQDDQPLEMIIVQGDEKKYSLRNQAENRLIFTISHGNRFSLPKLVTVLPQRISEEYELAYLVKNNDSYGSKFWLL
ncbi:unnamed protein product, partial [Trichobilharzia szidati]